MKGKKNLSILHLLLWWNDLLIWSLFELWSLSELRFVLTPLPSFLHGKQVPLWCFPLDDLLLIINIFPSILFYFIFLLKELLMLQLHFTIVDWLIFDSASDWFLIVPNFFSLFWIWMYMVRLIAWNASISQNRGFQINLEGVYNLIAMLFVIF